MYEMKRRSLEKINEIKAQEKLRVEKDCTFKPIITNYAKQNEVVKVAQNSSVTF